MKKAIKPVHDFGPAPPTLRSRIQTVLRDTDAPQVRLKKAPSVPRPGASPIAKTQKRPRSGTKETTLNQSGRTDRSVTPPKGGSIAALAKSLNQSLTLTAKRINLAISPDKSELLPLTNCWDSPRYVSSPKEEDSSGEERETIVSVLNSTVPSPEKTREREVEMILKKQFRLANVRLVPRQVDGRTPLPKTILLVQGSDCLLYDVILS